jgi:polyhydroxybutyrate depolymerase
VAFTAGIIDRLERDLCLDAKRIYAAGFSNGGGFVMTIACRLANRVAAVLSIAGYFFEPTGGCHPQRPISILEVHGAADDNVVYGGIPAGDDEPELLAVPVWLEQWARLDHCHSNPTVFMQTAQLTAERWSGCAARAEIEHYKLENFGHAIPTMLSARPFNAVAWSFLNRHRLE